MLSDNAAPPPRQLDHELLQPHLMRRGETLRRVGSGNSTWR